MSEERVIFLKLITEAQKAGARQAPACQIVGISKRTLQRWFDPKNGSDGRLQTSHRPANKLSELEQQRILKVANAAAYADLPPCKIVPKLADAGQYIASESTFYRILKEAKQLKHRQNSRPAQPRKKPKALHATGPNQIYTWDITYLRTRVRGLFFYLYLVVDLYSRKIVGWQIYDVESAGLAADLMIDICHREGVQPGQITLHSDNGSPMKGATMLSTLERLGVSPSFSRPSVSNDNPFSESLFRTLKHCSNYPEDPFETLAAARVWTENFARWYNTEHLHSGLKFVTPEQRHKAEDTDILAKRKQVYLDAKRKNPNRWSGDIRNWDTIKKVYLNPQKDKIENHKNRAA